MKQTRGTILVVDDLADWRKTMTEILKNEGYDVVSASSFDKAAALLAKEAFDVAIIDIRLVDWDTRNKQGIQLLDKVSPELGTQVIIATAYGTVETAREAFRDYGVFDYLVKQKWNPGEFRKKVREAVRVARSKKADTIS